MKAPLISSTRAKRRKAMALVMVVTTVALISMLIVAIFSLTRTEYKSTQSFVAARSAKQLADFAVAITQAQLQNAQNTNTSAASRTTHSTQPGMARVYNSLGNFVSAYKLYSSAQMVITSSSEAEIFSTANQVPMAWNATENKARYVDLNEPVVRPGLIGGTTAVFFPIIDPRAAYTGTNPATSQSLVAVEGFSYDNKTPVITGGGGSVNYEEVVLPSQASGNPDKLRLPMPVEWIYILQDGTTGALNASNNFISSQPGKLPSSTNPIVGRVAFWTDDESCKININTASEPTFFSPPYFYHQRDSKWANFPGAGGEYQRYPGHPATVALSAVLAPGINLDPYAAGLSTSAINNIVETKELIYGLMPKIAAGGSKSGSRPFVNDEFSPANGEGAPALNGDLDSARRERLFASVDEMLFQDDLENGNFAANGRIAARVAIPGQSGRFLMDHDTLERSRFFLTAHSRAPEFSIHGLPRVAMWPVADEGQGETRRTSFDNMIALCATLRGGTSGAAVANSYIFRRAEPHHPTHDVTGSTSGYGSAVGLSRNSKLLDYLYSQMTGLQFPRTSALGTSNDFGAKYGNTNAAQMVIQFFDYIRSTNLYDGVLARDNDASSVLDGNDNLNVSGTALYDQTDTLTKNRYTYTEQRATRKAAGSLKDGTKTTQGINVLSDNAQVLPGHGQVTPARWEKNGQVVQGFGRMFTLSEIGFQIICTADGKNDEEFPVDCGGILSGGGSAPKAAAPRASNEGDGNQGAEVIGAPYPPPPLGTLNPLGFRRWYSNFPPLTDTTGTLYGCNPADPLKHPSRHPGYFPQNWNLTLQTNIPLKVTEKRIQIMLLLETFCPMLGWTKFSPEWAITLDKDFIRSIKVTDTEGFDVPLFPTASTDVVVKSNGNLYESSNVYSLGGHAGPTAVSGGRSVPALGSTQIGNDTDPYVDGLARGASASRYVTDAPGHTGLNNYGLVSQFVTVPRKGPIKLKFGQRDLLIKIYDKHDRVGRNGEEIQTIRMGFDDMTLPAPALVYSGERRRTKNGPPQSLPVNRNEINHWWVTDGFGRLTWRRALQAPHWWCFNRMGCLGRMKGDVNKAFNGTNNLYDDPNDPSYDQTYDGADDQVLHGRLDNILPYNNTGTGGGSAIGIIPPEALTTNPADLNSPPLYDEVGNLWSGSDVIRTYVPAVGDYRLVAARNDVPRSMWVRHPVWEEAEKKFPDPANQPRRIHSFTTHLATGESGVVLPTAAMRTSAAQSPYYEYVKNSPFLVKDAPYASRPEDDGRIPDFPPSDNWAKVANSYGDFDNGIANSRDGPYLNKPDEGNFHAARIERHNITKFFRSGYFFEPWRNSDDWRSGVYMTPNRMVSSPVMFGSLPTGVWPGGAVSKSALTGSGVTFSDGKPWQTLLFRPYARSHASLGKSVTDGHPGDNNPRDHYLLDLFFMPVVEPYAISEPLSVAGRVNLNYQIVPFTNIRRATGMHALMKGEFMTTIPTNADVNNAKGPYSASLPTEQQRTAKSQSDWASKGDEFWDENNRKKYWHRPIDVTKTLFQFEQKFRHSANGANHAAARFRGLFRSPSQICEIHLIPDINNRVTPGENNGSISSITDTTSTTALQSVMDQFWQNHAPTGDNTRERPYSNLYSRVTTRSNTFRVHMRAQVIRKARSTSPATFDPVKDAVLGEYRGSSLIERYIDPTDNTAVIPDYANSTNPLSEVPLETFYKFRTLESKRFSP
jgi:uncharacterized protein (TIGR02600 family)